MAIQYIIHYDFIDPEGNVMSNQQTPPMLDRDEANLAWVSMKNNPCFANLRPEKIEPVRHVVNAEYVKNGNPYTFETDMAVKKGNWIVVERETTNPYTGETKKEKVVIQAVSDDHDEAESEIEKRFPITRLKKIFGVVKTK